MSKKNKEPEVKVTWWKLIVLIAGFIIGTTIVILIVRGVT